MRIAVANWPAKFRVASILPSGRSLNVNLTGLPKLTVLSTTLATNLAGFPDLKTYAPATSPVRLTDSMVSDVVA
jgi:hypothetical protein